MKEYIVALKEGVNYAQVWDDIENLSPGLPHIPERAIGIADNLDALDRVTHYYLTDAEAEEIRQDPRVLGVEIPAEHRDDIVISLNTAQVGTFTKTNSSTGNILNWGLIRNSNPTNVYGSSTSTTSKYNYTVNGSNVDIVIIDSGIQINHPEFGNRVNAYQWTNAVNTTTFYTDYDGHGTHVAGIAAGNTYGWAKNSNIYSIKFTAPANDPNPGFTGQTFGNIANLLVNWQNTKSINPATGVKNPTVVNMSFGYNYVVTANASVYTIANVNYRGNTYNTPGWANTTYGLIFGQGLIPARDPTYDVYVDQMTAAGMIVCKSAGNDGMKIDVAGGLDYNNSINVVFNSNSQLALSGAKYMQGSSPMSNTAIVVGALDSTTYSSSLDKKASYSDAGPMVDIFAAGSNIQSAWSSNSATAGSTYYANLLFRQNNIPGTSMASPQIAGLSALIAQANPTATPAQIKNRLLTVATTTMIGNVATNPSGTDYGNTVSQWGGNAGVAYMTYNSVNPLIIVGSN